MLESNFKNMHQRTPSDQDFQRLKLLDSKTALHNELEKLIKTAPPARQSKLRHDFDGFEALFSDYRADSDALVAWEQIRPLPDWAVKGYKDLPEDIDSANIKALLDKLVVIKLNGGLGTSMGCTGPKSLISVRAGLNFLDLTVQQIEHLNKQYGSSVPLVLMNSFNTEDDTQKIIQRYRSVHIDIHSFVQSTYPRLNRETLLPIAGQVCEQENETDQQESGWYPPGHGDIYRSFLESGLLDKFIDNGKEFVFISNIDNLGADVDKRILSFLVKHASQPRAPEFIMEVTDKTRADIKGGTLVQYDDKLRLLEIAQVPKQHVDEFKSVSKFKIFNTNNLWVNIAAMKRVVEEKTLHMEIIVNPKTLENGVNVIQLEQAVGAAIQSFDGAIGICVPRKRFLPVKMTSDLLMCMSNLYSLKSGTLEINTARSFLAVPLVKLGDSFKKVKEFLARFANIPNMLDLDHLTVSGDVTFGRDVTLRGTVIIIANHGERIDIPPGAILENKIVSGNLRILDH